MSPNGDTISRLLSATKPNVSFEFFPPKNQEGGDSLQAAFNELLEVNPSFVSVTYGAMGSNQETSLSVVQDFAKFVPTVAHLTCIGSTYENIRTLVNKYEDFGVAGILALRGDVPKDYEGESIGEFKTALELVELVSSESTLEIGVAAFPEVHPESAHLAHDIKVLKLKQDAGATFAVTQLFFDIGAYENFVKEAHNAGVRIPIIPGVMPIANAKQAMRMAQMSGAKVPTVLLSQLDEARDEDHARTIGMNFTIEFSRQLIQAGVPDLHVFTLNNSKAPIELLKGIGLA